MGSPWCLPGTVTSLHRPRHVPCHCAGGDTLLAPRARKAGGENWRGPGRRVPTAPPSPNAPHGAATTTTPRPGLLPRLRGGLGPAPSTAPSPRAPLSCGAPAGRAPQALGHHGGHSPGRRGSRGERGGPGCCLSAWLPAQCSPSSDCPFCLPAGQPRPHKTKRPVSAACGGALAPGPGDPAGTRGAVAPEQTGPRGAQRGPGGPCCGQGTVLTGEAGLCGSRSPRWLLRDGDWGGIGVTGGIAVTQSRGAAPPRPGTPADSTTTSQQIWVREWEGQDHLPSAGMPKWGAGGGMLLRSLPSTFPAHLLGTSWLRGEVSLELALQLAPTPRTCPGHGSVQRRVWRLCREPGATRGRAQPEQDGTPSAHAGVRKVSGTARPPAPHTGTCLPSPATGKLSLAENHPRAKSGAGSHPKRGARWGESIPGTAHAGHGWGWVTLSR